MILIGLGALVLAATVGVVGWLLYDDGMTVNILSGVFELLLGIAVAVFIVERVTRMQARRDWKVAYSAVNGLLAAFVDVMRLLFSRLDQRTYEANRGRHSEFVSIADLHISALRSSIEGFATALEPRSHQLTRGVELRLSWLMGKLRSAPGRPQQVEDQLRRTREIADDIAELLRRQGEGRYEVAIAVSRRIAEELCGYRAPRSFTEAVGWRLQGQSRLLEELGDSAPSGGYIIDDINNDLAIAYFALDRELLTIAASDRTQG